MTYLLLLYPLLSGSPKRSFPLTLRSGRTLFCIEWEVRKLDRWNPSYCAHCGLIDLSSSDEVMVGVSMPPPRHPSTGCEKPSASHPRIRPF